MASEGPNSGGTFASVAFGTNAWTNPSNAGASDNTYATAALSTHYLRCTNFGFSIPTGATIDGIVVECEAKLSSLSTPLRMRVVKASTETGDVKQNNTVTTTEQYWSEGGPSDLWGATWTVAEVNASGFGASITFPSTGAVTASVDHVRITVYYSEAGAPFRRSLLGVGF